MSNIVPDACWCADGRYGEDEIEAHAGMYVGEVYSIGGHADVDSYDRS